MTDTMTEREQLIAKVREVAERLGKTSLSKQEFLREAAIGENGIARRFDAWSALCVHAGLTPQRVRHRIADDDFFEAIRQAFIAYGGVCAFERLAPHLPFAIGQVSRRYRTRAETLEAFRRWLVLTGAEFPYMADIARWIARSNGPVPRLPPSAPPSAGPNDPSSAAPSARTWRQVDGRLVGEVIRFRGMLRAPTNELGVVGLFTLVAQDLGFEIDSIVRDFPDCLACRRIGPGRFQQVRIEFEFLSKNFVLHGHDPKGCDIIVCWENNWGPECPLEVIVLKDEIKRLSGYGGQ